MILNLYAVFKVHSLTDFVSQQSSEPKGYELYLLTKCIVFKKIRQPPAFPYRRQHSIIGRLSLNHRVRDGNGCDPQAYRHRKKPGTESNGSSISSRN